MKNLKKFKKYLGGVLRMLERKFQKSVGKFSGNDCRQL